MFMFVFVCLFVSLGARPVLAFLQVNLFFFEFYSALMFILSCFCFLLSCKTLLLLLLLLSFYNDDDDDDG